MAKDLKERGGLDLSECFVDAMFVGAKKEDEQWERPSEARARSSLRWKIERLFAWLVNLRLLVVRYERKADNYLDFMWVGCIIILLRHL